MLSVAVRLFSNEQLVNPAWEPVTFGWNRKKRAKQPRRLPNIDGVLALFCVSLHHNRLAFNPSFSNWYWPRSCSTIVASMEGALIAAVRNSHGAFMPRYRWRETFSLNLPRAKDWLGATLMGVGLIPVALFLQSLQNYFWPSAGNDLYDKLFNDLLHQYPVIAPIIVGLSAGICEELLYRGPIQTAFLRRFPPWFSISATAALFSLAHFEAHGAPLRLLLGALLGWMVYRQRSIYPAMLTHALFDGVQLAWQSYDLHHNPATTLPATTPAASGLPMTTSDIGLLIGGAGLVLMGFWLYQRRSNEQTDMLVKG